VYSVVSTCLSARQKCMFARQKCLPVRKMPVCRAKMPVRQLKSLPGFAWQEKVPGSKIASATACKPARSVQIKIALCPPHVHERSVCIDKSNHKSPPPSLENELWDLGRKKQYIYISIYQYISKLSGSSKTVN
jgi:hypothetical protein